jgi:hypothetical protein
VKDADALSYASARIPGRKHVLKGIDKFLFPGLPENDTNIEIPQNKTIKATAMQERQSRIKALVANATSGSVTIAKKPIEPLLKAVGLTDIYIYIWRLGGASAPSSRSCNDA